MYHTHNCPQQFLGFLSCFKRSTYTSSGLPDRGKPSSSKLPFLKRLNRFFAGRIESTSSPVVLHMLLVASIALWSTWNSWSINTRISLGERFIFSPWSTSISIALLSFERYSYSLCKAETRRGIYSCIHTHLHPAPTLTPSPTPNNPHPDTQPTLSLHGDSKYYYSVKRIITRREKETWCGFGWESFAFGHNFFS
jgi:hypothetical protein